MKIAVDFYKELFSKEARGEVSLSDDFWEDRDRVTREENDMLTAPFSEEEIKKCHFQLLCRRGPRPRWAPFSLLSKVLGHYKEGHS